eukprot:3086202-Amphidinium_carterae.3
MRAAAKKGSCNAIGLVASSALQSSWFHARLEGFLAKSVGMAAKGAKASNHLKCMKDMPLSSQNIDLLLKIGLDIPDLNMSLFESCAKDLLDTFSSKVKDIYRAVAKLPETDLTLLQKLLSETCSLCPKDPEVHNFMVDCGESIRAMGLAEVVAKLTSLLDSLASAENLQECTTACAKVACLLNQSNFPDEAVTQGNLEKPLQMALSTILLKFADNVTKPWEETLHLDLEKLLHTGTQVLNIMSNKEQTKVLEAMLLSLDLKKAKVETQSSIQIGLTSDLKSHVPKAVHLQRLLMQLSTKGKFEVGPEKFSTYMKDLTKEVSDISVNMNQTLVDGSLKFLSDSQKSLQTIAGGAENGKDWLERAVIEEWNDLKEHAKQSILTIDGKKLLNAVELAKQAEKYTKHHS